MTAVENHKIVGSDLPTMIFAGFNLDKILIFNEDIYDILYKLSESPAYGILFENYPYDKDRDHSRNMDDGVHSLKMLELISMGPSDHSLIVSRACAISFEKFIKPKLSSEQLTALVLLIDEMKGFLKK